MYAFANCDLALEFINIPASVNEIWSDAFSSCSSLKAIQINGDENMEINEYAFYDCKNLTIYFPNIDSKPAGWDDFSGIDSSRIKWGESYIPAP